MTLGAAIGFTGNASAADKPQFQLTDPKLPLFELQPLDRRVWVFTLEGTWDHPANPGAHHYVNILFPNGQAYSNRVDENLEAIRTVKTEYKNGVPVYSIVEDSPFRRGEVRCLIQKYQLVRNGVAKGGKFTIVISAGKRVTSADDPAVISNAVEVTWPMNRPIVRRPPRTRHSAPEAADPFLLPDEQPMRALIPLPSPDKK
jgi:hypothetical protein